MLEQLIQRARRRFVMQQSVAGFALASAVALAGFALLLILGTRYLQVWVIVLLAGAAAAWAAFRVVRGIPDPYRVAVLLDGRAGLQDTLSTALHFHSGKKAGGFLSAQFEQAEQAAGSVALESALPFVFPKALYAAIGFVLLNGVLVITRLSSGAGLNLNAPLTEVLFVDRAIDQKKPPAPLVAKKQSAPGQKQEMSQQELTQEDIEKAIRDGKAPPGKDKDATSRDNGDGKSLMAQLKDAVADMMKQDDSGGKKSGQDKKGKGEQPQEDQKGDKAKPGSKLEDAKDGDTPSDDKKGPQKPGESNPTQKSAQDGGGSGHEDGSKEIRKAEELKALGKVSDLIGKRSAAVTGESSVEAKSGGLPLVTGYSESAAKHGQASGGGVNRDEIPLSLQPYVEHYFEAVKKTAPAPK